MKGTVIMADYQKMYHRMFNAATEAAKLMEVATSIIRAAQRDCEEIYIRTAEPADDAQVLAPVSLEASCEPVPYKVIRTPPAANV